MKKVFSIISILLCLLTFSACGIENKELASSNMSEITELYFCGFSGSNKASISVGRRENPYIKDGKHGKMCDFSLISLSTQGLLDMRKLVRLYINEEMYLIELELVAGVYMYDLEYKIDKNDSVRLAFDEVIIGLCRTDFEIDYNKAIEIGCNSLEKQFEEGKNGKALQGECYLKLLNKAGEDEVFWCFSLLMQSGELFNVIIDVHTGEIFD